MSQPSAEDDREHPWGCFLPGLLLGLPFFLFLPLILAAIEHKMWGTHHVEDFCREAGIHGFLDWVYSPIIPLLDKIL